MEYQILGANMQAVVIRLHPGERVFSQSGAMVWMDGWVKMDTRFKGGLLKSIARRLAGESLAFTYYEPHGQPGEVGFAPQVPGKIIPVELRPGYEVICQKNAFQVAQEGVEVSLHLQEKLGVGLFGGEGFIMQRLHGQGLAFCEIDGEVVEKELQPGQELLVDTAHVAMYESTVEMSIQRVKGFKNVLFGGEGLFLTTLRGPGKVWLQTMTLSHLAGRVAQLLPSGGIGDGDD